MKKAYYKPFLKTIVIEDEDIVTLSTHSEVDKQGRALSNERQGQGNDIWD